MSTIHKDGELARRLVDVLDRLEKGEPLEDAFTHAGITRSVGARVLQALRDELAVVAPKKKPKRSAAAAKAGSHALVAYADGGSRGNPGEAACAAIVCDEDGEELLRRSRRLGRATNNVAEYEGVVLALTLCSELKARRVLVCVDSELVAKQVQGSYKVKHPALKPYHERVVELSRDFDQFAIEYIPRKDNAEADKLVNLALDGKAEE